MRKFYIIFLFLFRNGIGDLYAQEVSVKHKILKGETIEVIAKKYNVSSDDIYSINPELVNGFKENDIIIISKYQKNQSNKSTIFHIVQANETKFGLAKKYNISIQELERQNPQIIAMLQKGHELIIESFGTYSKKNISPSNENVVSYVVKKGETLSGIARNYRIALSELIEENKSELGAFLQIGQVLKIPQKFEQKKIISTSTSLQSHTVEAGETKYGLSKRFGITISELERLNPQIVDMLRTGQHISFPPKTVAEAKATKTQSPIVTEPTVSKNDIIVEEKTKPATNRPVKELISYEVKPKETLYGLSKMTGLTQEELTALNPELSNGLKTGMILKIPSDSKITSEVVILNTNPISEKGLLNTIVKTQAKEIAFLMPFSEEIYFNYLKSPKNTKEFKSNLEFYAGASIAIDSLKRSNVLVKSKFLKIQESAESEIDLSNLVNANIENYKAVICISNEYDFEKVGNFLSEKNIPFILSDIKESSVTAKSTYIGLPSKMNLSKLILDFLVSKNENVIIVNDPARVESKNHITENYPDVKFVKFTENGFLNSESLKSLLSSSKKNYVVLDTDDAGLILSSTTLLLKDLNAFNIQIALLEPKEELKGEGLSDIRFRALKMIHPSINKPSNLAEISSFKRNFFKKYGFDPTPEAIKGFDITFDALVRLFQEKDFESLAQERTTEQINFKFKYVKNVEEGYFNSGGYILQFDETSNNKIIN